MDSDAIDKELGAHKPGDTIQLTVVRLDEFKEFSLTYAVNPHPTYTLKPMDNMTAQQKAIYDAWLGIK
jgi:predicted metalloprotease with PDZ domain